LAIFSYQGVDIAYSMAGVGDPVVLIHGFASNHHTNWGNTGWINKLVQHGKQVIALDLRGHGNSTKFHSPADYHPHLMGEDVIRLMDHLQIERADIIGYSMGSWISSHLMILYAERVNAVVLGGAGDNILLNFNNRTESVARSLTTPNPDEKTQPFLRDLREFAELLGNDLRALAACTRGLYRAGLPELGQSSRPVLLITGEADDVAGSPYKFAELIPGAQTILVPSCDHLTALIRNAFKIEVLKFLGQHQLN